MFTSTRSAGAAQAASVTAAMFKLCCFLFLLIGDALWGCRTGLAREGAPGAEGTASVFIKYERKLTAFRRPFL
jgi:hypothetical protein